ncbi:MAG: hypothetical protein EPO21_01790 [Chloroflexota bacterium]|nr:MAG: hypothetical protein EPO21_01790 [Chloroflexota bacterium]
METHMGKSSSPFRGFHALLATLSVACLALIWQGDRDVEAQTVSSVSGTVWFDDNANGILDPGELRAAGLTVTAAYVSPSTTMTQAVTDGSGTFTLALPPGTYTLSAGASQKPGASLPGGAKYLGTSQVMVTTGGTVANLGLQPKGQDLTVKIEVVWPHGLAGEPQPVSQAPLANVAAMIFQGNSRLSVSCEFSATVRLWQGLNTDAARAAAVGTRRTVTEGDKTYPIWEFQDVDVSATRDPLNKYYFFATVEGGGSFPYQSSTNVWAHAADARTYFPTADRPTSTSATPGALDSRIQVVWPHDRLGNSVPITQSQYVNITASFFQHGTLISIPPGWGPNVHLYQSLNSDAGVLVTRGIKRTVTVGDLTYPVWDFNDVPVDQAMNPNSKYFFAVLADGVPTYPAIWTHGADGRTYFPSKDVPENSCGS